MENDHSQTRERIRAREYSQQLSSVDTGGGAYVDEGVGTRGGDFVGRDKHVIMHLPKVHSDQGELGREDIDGQKNAFQSLLGKIRILLFGSRYLENYRARIIPQFRQLTFLERARPLDLEKIYVSLRISDHMKREFIPDHIVSRAHESTSLVTLRRRERAVDIESALGYSSRLVIMGDPGTGKTTLAKHLILRAAKQDPRLAKALEGSLTKTSSILPILIVLNDFAQSGRGIVEYAAHILSKWHDSPGLEYLVERKLSRGETLIIFDGLDEVADEEVHQRVVAQINAFATKYGDCNQIIVTSRIAGYRYLLENFILLEITPFDHNDIMRFVCNWFEDSPQRAEALIEALRESERITLLASNPFMLSIISLVYEQNWKLPERRVDLYQECIKLLLHDWDRFKGVTRKMGFPTRAKEKALGLVAYRFHQMRKRVFSEEELLTVLTEILPRLNRIFLKDRLEPIPGSNSQGFLEEILMSTGLVVRLSRTTFSFTHLTIQEYFTAQVTVELPGTLRVLEYKRDPWWREVILLAAGMLRDATGFIRGILELEEGAQLVYIDSVENLLLAAHCLRDADWTDSTLREYLVQRIIRWLNISDEYQDYPAVEGLISSLGEEGWWQIQVMAKSPEPETRSKAIDLIAAITGPSAAPLLLEMARNDPSLKVRELAIQAMRMAWNDDIIRYLTEVIGSGTDDVEMRTAAIQTLAVLGEIDSQMERYLLNVLGDSKQPSVLRIAAAEGLHSMADKSCQRKLIQLLGTIENPEIRALTVRTLGVVGAKENVPVLSSILQSPMELLDTRVAAAEALSNIGDSSALQALINTFQEADLSDDLVCALIDILISIGGGASGRVLDEFLRSQQCSNAARAHTLTALREAGTEASIVLLVKLARHEHQSDWVKILSVEALQATSYDLRHVILRELAEDSGLDTLIKLTATIALRYPPRDHNLWTMVVLLEDYLVASPAIGEDTSPKTLDTDGLLSEKSPTDKGQLTVRILKLLAEEPQDMAIPIVTHYALEETQTQVVRLEAVNCLAKLGVEKAKLAIRQIVEKSADEMIKIGAIEQLGLLRCLKATPMLVDIALQKDSSKKTRKASIESLAKMNDRRPFSSLKDIVLDEVVNNQTRLFAIEAICQSSYSEKVSVVIEILRNKLPAWLVTVILQVVKEAGLRREVVSKLVQDLTKASWLSERRNLETVALLGETMTLDEIEIFEKLANEQRLSEGVKEAMTRATERIRERLLWGAPTT